MDETQLLSLYVGEKEFKVNPKEITPDTTLNSFLRDHAHFTSTKRSCLEGGCGACIVAVEKIDHITREKRILAVNSCLISIYSCAGWNIHTNEGIGNPIIGYHPLQKKLSDGNGSQCGFCSSGMIMNMYALVQAKKPTVEEIENSFAGNICRCTGYRPILDSWKSFVTNDIEDYRPCKESCLVPCDMPCTKVKNLVFGDNKTKWLKLYYLKDLLMELNIIMGSYMLIAGNTAHGVYKQPTPLTYLDVLDVKELTSWSHSDNFLTLGANISLNRTREIFYDIAKNSQFSYLSKMSNHMDLIANIPVRNIGTIAGNLMLKHQQQEFQSDMFLILETVDAQLVIVDTAENEIRRSPRDFLRLDMNKKVITSVILKGYPSDFMYGSYKIMPRAQNTPATVNAGFLLNLQKGIVKSARIVYGGINPKFVHASNTERFLINKNLFNNAVLKQAYQLLSEEVLPDYVLPADKPEYRKNLAISLFYKFVLSIAPADKITSRNKSGGSLLERPLSSGSQEFATIKSRYPLSQPMVKLEALAQTTGQAEYIEDLPDRPGQLFCSFVLANAPAGSTITGIDKSLALKHPEVVAFFGKNDIPGSNIWSPPESHIFSVKEVLFCEGIVEFFDQPVGIIVATSQEIAEEASKMVIVRTKTSPQKPLLNVREVLMAPADVQKKRISILDEVKPSRKGTDVQNVVKGDFFIGHQYHFHMELQCCSVVPIEDGLDVYPSTQWIDCTQISIASVLNLKNSQINVRVKRLGGAFGAKIVRSSIVACAAALAAYKLRKPVKMRLPLVTNMKIMGKRYPLYIKYEAGVNHSGIIQYLDASLYSDWGTGGNEPMTSMLISMFKNGYVTDTWKFTTFKVQTDTPPNSYARAPGTLTGLCAVESIMEHIAYSIKVDPYQMKLDNTDKVHQKIFDFDKDLRQWADIEKRRQAIEEFNRNNRWRKRGMSIVPMSWILEVHAGFIVLLSIFHGDGSVAITHSGIEMGQGINTKVAQVAAYKLGIPMDLIHIKPSTALTGPNASTTGGSITTEAVCFATMEACDILLNRMKPVKKTMFNPTWQELVQKCFDGYINLSTTANFAPDKPNIHEYFIYGLCATEVEVDILTGKHEVLRVDIIEDVGDSMNPTIDIGQVEGAFVMGLGYFTTEQIIFSPDGEILTNRTWNYLPPGPKDIPINFRIKFPGNIPNNVGVLNSKATAEPPCCLATTVPLAIRNAVSSARSDADPKKPSWYKVDGCSTTESTFLNSLNDFNQYSL